MPIFTLNRDHTLNSRLGVCVNFEKNKPTFVPPQVRAEVENLGGELVSEDAGAAAPATAEGQEPQGDARTAALNDAFAKHALANGVDKPPSVKAMHEAMGWTPTAAERDAAWEAFKAAK